MNKHHNKSIILEAILCIVLILFIFFVLWCDLGSVSKEAALKAESGLAIQESLAELRAANLEIDRRVSNLEKIMEELKTPEPLVEEDPIPLPVEEVVEEPLTGKDLYISYVKEICDLYDNVTPALVMSVIEHESNWNASVTNGKEYPNTCIGLMQVSQRWHGKRAESLGVSDLYDPYGNILTGTDYLSELIEDYAGGDVTLALMLYNMNWDKARSFYSQGIVSQYAQSVLDRAAELEVELDAEREGG